ncbi:MAG TPA: hypothetical protein VMV40_08050 [Acidiferrobacter sp.]|nr:hypothetical protein [Acidiferrobacter sp.]
MGRITFLAAPFEAERIVTVAPDCALTLLTLTREMPWPPQKMCGDGMCGACAVKVVLLDTDGVERTVSLSLEEKMILYQVGKLTDAEYRASTLPVSPALWRLACQYVVRDEDILVFV